MDQVEQQTLANFSDEIKAEQVRLLYKQAPSTLALGWVAAIVGVLLLWQIADSEGLIAWIAGLTLLTLLRLVMWRLYIGRSHTTESHFRWGTWYIFSAAVSGIAWGTLMFLFSDTWPAAYQIILILLLIGIVAGAVPANSAIFSCFLAFMVPIVVLVVFVLATRQDFAYQILSVLTVIFSVQVGLASKKFANNLIASLQAQFENKNLAQQLSRANSDLKVEIEDHQKAGESLQAANQQLWDSNLLFSQAEQIGNLGHWEWDETSSCYLACSEQYASICGLTSEEIMEGINNFREDLTLIHEDDRERYIQTTRKACEEKIPWDIEYRYVRPSGEQIYIHELAQPVLDRQGEIVRIVGTIQDITDRKQLEERLRFLSVHDPLTGLYNRRALEYQMAGELSRQSRYGRGLSVFMLDLDHFKSINDSYGHESGDVVLKELASIIKNTVRKSDYVARYGGEEFVIVLPETTIEKAADLAERVRKKIAGQPITLPDEIELQVTASIGVAAVRESTDSWESVIGLADKAMYEAKHAGRNRCELAK